jgi:hypothetical protein
MGTNYGVGLRTGVGTPDPVAGKNFRDYWAAKNDNSNDEKAIRLRQAYGEAQA